MGIFHSMLSGMLSGQLINFIVVHFQMEDNKICEMGRLKKFHFKFFWLINSNQNLVQFKKINGLYSIAYTINIPIIPWI
jgi:hypothetical protein